MMKSKLNWKRPLFYALLPIFFVMIFLGFPLPMAPPPAMKTGQEQSQPVKKKKKKPLSWQFGCKDDDQT